MWWVILADTIIFVLCVGQACLGICCIYLMRRVRQFEFGFKIVSQALEGVDHG